MCHNHSADLLNHCGYHLLYLHNRTEFIVRWEVNTPVCMSRKLICKQSRKRLEANCKVGISGKTMSYVPSTFKDRHKYTLGPGVNWRVNASQHHSKSELVFTQIFQKAFPTLPLLEILRFLKMFST